jgi:hypothetical protein
LFSERDYVVSGGLSSGYYLLRMEGPAAHLSPVWVTEYTTWEEASRKARLAALAEGVHAWGRESDTSDYIELVMAQHPHAPWWNPWHPFDRTWVDKAVPRVSGIYILGDGHPAFIGHSNNLHTRLVSHLLEPLGCLADVQPLLFSVHPDQPGRDWKQLHGHLVSNWKPRCNNPA